MTEPRIAKTAQAARMLGFKSSSEFMRFVDTLGLRAVAKRGSAWWDMKALHHELDKKAKLEPQSVDYEAEAMRRIHGNVQNGLCAN